MKATLEQIVDETYDQLDNLESLCDLFFRTRRYTIYKNISGTLRLLLTGSSGQPGLALTALPNGTLPKLKKVPDSTTPPDMLVLPAAVWINSGEAHVRLGNGTVTTRELDLPGSALDAMTIDDVFDATSPTLPIQQWLQQPFLRPVWTLRKFIGTVANKDGGAHHEPNPVIKAMQKFGHLHWHLTAGIAKSVYPIIRTQLLSTYPKHVRPVR